MICTPSVRSVAVTEALHFVILACDGLWDCLSSAEAVRFVQHALRTAGANANSAVRQLAQAALDAGAEDNVSILLFVFEHTREGGIVPPPDALPDSDADPGSDASSAESDAHAAASGVPRAAPRAQAEDHAVEEVAEVQ